MKAHYLLAPLAAIALAGCTVYRPVAYTPVVTTPAPVATTTYVVPSTTVLGASNWSLMDSDGDGFSNGVDRQPYNALFR
jgi:tetrahydromethanopterin S-methyltransferase subunit D